MSRSDQIKSFGKYGVTLIAMLLLAGCGFQPLYGENTVLSDGETPVDVIDELSKISIVIAVADDVDGRGSGLVGFETRNQLIDLLGAQNVAATTYELQVRLRGFRRGLAVQSDASVTRFNYELIGSYELFDLGKSKAILTGNSRAFSAYNVVDSEFATVTARRDAEFRAARNIAEDMKLQLALFFKSDRSWRLEVDAPEDSLDNLPSYEKGSPRVPDDRPVGEPAPDETGDTATP